MDFLHERSGSHDERPSALFCRLGRTCWKGLSNRGFFRSN